MTKIHLLHLLWFQVPEDEVTEVSEATDATDISEASDQDNNKKVPARLSQRSITS